MPRILVIDDDVLVGSLLKEHLSSEGFSVQVATLGEEGLSAAKKLLPDLIFLDVNLPDATGFQICGRFRALPETKTVPIVMMTGAARSASQQSIGRQMGANDYILKPFNVDDVTAKVHALLGTIPPEHHEPEPTPPAKTASEPETISYPTVSPPTPWQTNTAQAQDSFPMFNFDVNTTPTFDSSNQAATALKKSDPMNFPDLMCDPPSVSEDAAPAIENLSDAALSVMPVKPLEEAPMDIVPFFTTKTEPVAEENPSAPIDISHTPPPEPGWRDIERSEPARVEELTEKNAVTAEPPMVEPIPSLAEALKLLPKEEPPVTGSQHSDALHTPIEPLPTYRPIIIDESKPEPEPETEPEPQQPLESLEMETPVQPDLGHTFDPHPFASPRVEKPSTLEEVPEPVFAKAEPVKPVLREESEVERGPIGAFFFDRYRIGVSLISLHIALVLGSEVLAGATITELVRGMALTVGGWALLLGLLTACTSLLDILLSGRMAVEILGLGAIPLAMRAAIGLYHEKTATVSFQQLIGNTSVLPPSTFWLHPLDLFQLAALLIMGIALTSKPGGTPRRSILAMALLAVVWSFFGRGYFRPF